MVDRLSASLLESPRIYLSTMHPVDSDGQYFKGRPRQYRQFSVSRLDFQSAQRTLIESIRNHWMDPEVFDGRYCYQSP